MDPRARIALAAFAISLFHAANASAEDDKSSSDPCLRVTVAPQRSDGPAMPKTVGGIVFQEKVISPGGALVSEVSSYMLLDSANAAVAFTKTDAGRPGWVLLAPADGLGESSYSVAAKVSCTDGTTADRSAAVTVGADAPLPTAVGTVTIGESFVAAPPNGGNKSFDAVVVWVKPTAELEKYLGVAAWRVTAIAPDGKPHASQWIDYGGAALLPGQTDVRLSVSAFCPAKGPQKIEVEAAIPGRERLLATSSWDVGELECDSSAPQGGASSAQNPSSGSSSSSSCALSTSRSETGGAALVFAALGFAAITRRRSAGARKA
jgi:hypothetical protein